MLTASNIILILYLSYLTWEKYLELFFEFRFHNLNKNYGLFGKMTTEANFCRHHIFNAILLPWCHPNRFPISKT